MFFCVSILRFSWEKSTVKVSSKFPCIVLEKIKVRVSVIQFPYMGTSIPYKEVD